MKRKALLIIMTLLMVTSVFAAPIQKDPKGWGALDDSASAQVGIQIRPEDVSYHLIGFTQDNRLQFPKEPSKLEKIQLVLTEDRTAAIDNPEEPMYIYYYIIAPTQPKLSIIAGSGLERTESDKKIAYDITVDTVEGKASSGDLLGLELPLKDIRNTGGIGGAYQFHIKTTTPITVDMASSTYEWHDTITLKLTSGD